MFLKISNRGRLPRECLEMVGLSSKKGRSKATASIGQFGSGTKYAAAAALRLGIHTGISSTDAHGVYYLMFSSEPIQPEGYDAHRRIMYDYYVREGTGARLDYRHGTDRAVEAFPDWDKPIGSDDKRLFKILREHVCNAYDEDRKFAVTFTDQHVLAGEGEAVVYLGDDPEFHDMIVDHPARYFKFLSGRKPIYTVPDLGEIWTKSDKGATRSFLMGVLVGCTNDPDEASVLDYSVNDKQLLSEERILKNHYDFKYRVAQMFGRLENKTAIRFILRSVMKSRAPYEADVLSRATKHCFTTAATAVWKEVVQELLGERLAVTSGKPHVDEDARQIMGYKVPANLPDSLCRFLQHLGYPKADEVLPQVTEADLRRVRLEELAPKEQAKFHRAYRLFAENFPDQTNLPIVLFQPLSERLQTYLGMAVGLDTTHSEIWLAVKNDLTFPPEHDVYKTLAHEARHCVTKASDLERAFVDQADNDLALAAYRAAGYAKYPGTDIAVRRLAPPRTPKFAPIEQEEIAVDITDELAELALSDTLKT